MLKPIIDNWLEGLITQSECIMKIINEDCGNDYAWYYDFVQHVYNESDTEKITKYILKPMRDAKLLF